jgi:hypothetical protein
MKKMMKLYETERCVMKRLAVLFAVFFTVAGILARTGLFAQTASSPGTVEISFTYTRQSGFASNQFAVWIEDAQGRYVKTLYATRFTAEGGYAIRLESIPDWVKKSRLADMSKTQVDALTGATPKTGLLSYRWNGTDQAGAAVPAGEYRIFLEASLRGGNRVLYSAPVQLGASSGPAVLQPQYFGNDTRVRAMISGVKVSSAP